MGMQQQSTDDRNFNH